MFSLQFDPAPRAGEPLVSRRVPDYFLVSLLTFNHRPLSAHLLICAHIASYSPPPVYLQTFADDRFTFAVINFCTYIFMCNPYCFLVFDFGLLKRVYPWSSPRRFKNSMWTLNAHINYPFLLRDRAKAN
jgi:hypothetical protein